MYYRGWKQRLFFCSALVLRDDRHLMAISENGVNDMHIWKLRTPAIAAAVAEAAPLSKFSMWSKLQLKSIPNSFSIIQFQAFCVGFVIASRYTKLCIWFLFKGFPEKKTSPRISYFNTPFPNLFPREWLLFSMGLPTWRCLNNDNAYVLQENCYCLKIRLQ